MPDSSKMPAFVNVYALTKTPKKRVIPYFTKTQWNAFVSRQKIKKRSKLRLDEFEVRYQLVPNGRGEVMITPNPAFRGRLTGSCKPIIQVVPRGGLEARLVVIGYKCDVRVKHCVVYFEAYTNKIPEGHNGIGCDDTDCSGRCFQEIVGTLTDGLITCRCRPL